MRTIEIEHKAIERLADAQAKSIPNLLKWLECRLDRSLDELAAEFHADWKGWFLYKGGSHLSIHAGNGAARLIAVF